MADVTVKKVRSAFSKMYTEDVGKKLLKSKGNKKSKLQKKGEKAIADYAINLETVSVIGKTHTERKR